ncbi:phytoene/squalene synthase family protein [Kitasatospora sp. RB6PN24]|uniref:phytoene/squalene synthase family protein n=1 Tax=Kitasatospora humi TaxID=2893891 RepID=UPI001E33386B|nr:phytoene/squalene synthase family protein [Kitasatospora humi]MCC9311094.1 phytoene/squalene synthase family protein [Kitasatospora humi]
MSSRELHRAGIAEPALREAYRQCRALNAAHGRTYFLATRMLSPDRRPAVHALYGFARWADEIVDDQRCRVPVEHRAAALHRLAADLRGAMATGWSSEPVCVAVADTARRYRIPYRYFEDFLAAMRQDLHTTDYPSFADLRAYMHGSAAVIGLQCLPVLGTVTDPRTAAPHAAGLGIAFQVTNFIRDVGEDLDRGRVYLPADQLAAHGVDRGLLAWCRRTGRGDQRVVAALRDQIGHARSLYRWAALGVPMLAVESRPCVGAALVLYRGILDEIEQAGPMAVLHRRVSVPRRRRARVAAIGLYGVLAARRAARRGVDPVGEAAAEHVRGTR